MVLLRFNKQINEWDVVEKEDKQEGDLYLDGFLKKKLDFALKHQDKNNDVLGIIEGKEGTGKSSLAGNVMRYVTKDNFNPDTQMIGSDYDDALKKISEAPHGSVLFFDEGNSFFMGTSTMTREHRDLHKVFSIFRQKNLFVIICLPSFLRLGTYFALDRSHFLLRTYVKGTQRGYFMYFGEKKKDQLYRVGKRDGYNKDAVRSNFRGRFTKCITLESKEYKSFKLKTLTAAINKARGIPDVEAPKPPTPEEVERAYRDKLILANKELSSRELSKVIGISHTMIANRRKALKQPLSLQEDDTK